jgi:hypothetical protein
MTPEELQLLRQVEATLRGIINSCAHPDIAIRALLVELKPIRETLKEIQKTLDNQPK